MVVGIEEFSRKTQRYMDLAEKIDLYVVDQHRSVVWHIYCRKGSLWDRLAKGLSGILDDSPQLRMPLQCNMVKKATSYGIDIEDLST